MKKEVCKECGKLIADFENAKKSDNEYVCEDCYNNHYFTCVYCGKINKKENGYLCHFVSHGKKYNGYICNRHDDSELYCLPESKIDIKSPLPYVSSVLYSTLDGTLDRYQAILFYFHGDRNLSPSRYTFGLKHKKPLTYKKYIDDRDAIYLLYAKTHVELEFVFEKHEDYEQVSVVPCEKFFDIYGNSSGDFYRRTDIWNDGMSCLKEINIYAYSEDDIDEVIKWKREMEGWLI